MSQHTIQSSDRTPDRVYRELLPLSPAKSGPNHRYEGTCPFHAHIKGRDGTLYVDPDGSFRTSCCDAAGDTLRFVQLLYSCSPKRALEIIREIEGGSEAKGLSRKVAGGVARSIKFTSSQILLLPHLWRIAYLPMRRIVLTFGMLGSSTLGVWKSLTGSAGAKAETSDRPAGIQERRLAVGKLYQRSVASFIIAALFLLALLFLSSKTINTFAFAQVILVILTFLTMGIFNLLSAEIVRRRLTEFEKGLRK